MPCWKGLPGTNTIKKLLNRGVNIFKH
jgi:hypothetical protein